jgi:hypothetical protein
VFSPRNIARIGIGMASQLSKQYDGLREKTTWALGNVWTPGRECFGQYLIMFCFGYDNMLAAIRHCFESVSIISWRSSGTVSAGIRKYFDSDLGTCWLGFDNTVPEVREYFGGHSGMFWLGRRASSTTG